jgi:hypothetical protein
MRTDAERIIGAAETELENTRQIWQKHLGDCPLKAAAGHHGCAECASISRHLERCQEQVELLGQPAETGALF